MEKWYKFLGLIMMSPEIMVTMVGIVTVPSGTIVKMVGLIKVSS